MSKMNVDFENMKKSSEEQNKKTIRPYRVILGLGTYINKYYEIMFKTLLNIQNKLKKERKEINIKSNRLNKNIESNKQINI